MQTTPTSVWATRPLRPMLRWKLEEFRHANWQAIHVRTQRAHRLPHEAGLKLLAVLRAPKELPVSALIRNPHDITDWKLLVES